MSTSNEQTDDRSPGADVCRWRRVLTGLRRSMWLVLIGAGLLGIVASPDRLATGIGWSRPALAADVGNGDQAVVHVVDVSGVIDLGLAPFISRVLEEAAADSADAVVLDIDTFGGRVDAAVLIRDAILDSDIETIAFIDPRAISAGALISLACTRIAMSPGGSIGAATPVTGGTGGEMEAADEKVISYWRAEMRSTAEHRGRPGDIAAAMVDPDVEIEDVIEEGKLLTLTTSEAIELGVADLVGKTLDDVLDQLGMGGAEIVETRVNWAERVARVVSNPALSSLLLSLGFLGLMIELYQPGWGIPGTIGIIALLIFFLGHYVVRLAGFEEMLLFGIGLGLVLLELLVIPGFGIAGIAGIITIAVAIVLAMLGLDWRVSWDLGFMQEAIGVVAATMLTVAFAGFLIVKFLPRSRFAGPFILRDGLDADAGYTSHSQAGRAEVGTVGTAITDLHPSGTVRLEGHRVDAVSEGGFIEQNAAVVLVGWATGNAVVRRAEPES